MGKTANIDGDVLKYLAGFACQKTIWTHNSGNWFEGKEAANEWFIEERGGPAKNDKGSRPGIMAWMKENWIESEWESEIELEPFKNCAFIIDGKIAEVKAETGCDDVRICLTPSVTFRHEVAFTKPYKGNRTSPKPEYAEKILQYYMDNYNTVITDGLEADDIMGMQSKGNVTASNDKDMKMIAGEHYNFSTGEHFFVDPIEADRWFYVQLLAGDPTDNIAGVPGIGVKKAEDIVDYFYETSVKDLVEDVQLHYADAYEGAWREVMEEHAKLVYILRPGDTPDSDGWRALLNEEAA